MFMFKSLFLALYRYWLGLPFIKKQIRLKNKIKQKIYSGTLACLIFV